MYAPYRKTNGRQQIAPRRCMYNLEASSFRTGTGIRCFDALLCFDTLHSMLLICMLVL